MDYGYKPTTNGRALIAKCMAREMPLVLTRVAFGSGLVLDSTDLADVHELITYIADGSIGDRTHQDNRFHFVVQYDNSSHPDVPTFYMNEFIVYGRDPDTGEDVDLLYATLGDYKQPVPAYSASIPASIWKFPVELIISDELLVSVDAPAGLITYDDLHKAVDHSVQALANSVGSAIIRDITIPVEGWAPATAAAWAEVGEDPDVQDDYKYMVDVAMAEALAAHVPNLAFDRRSLRIASEAAVCPTIYTLDGIVRFFAEEIPVADMAGTILLRSENTKYTGGGCECPDIATDEEVKDEVDDLFGETDTDPAPDDDGATDEDVPDGYIVATDEEVNAMNKDIFGKKPLMNKKIFLIWRKSLCLSSLLCPS